jgi:hypothetical protein
VDTTFSPSGINKNSGSIFDQVDLSLNFPQKKRTSITCNVATVETYLNFTPFT